MPFQVSPGVNVSEIDLTTIVPAVSTTTGAIAGVFNWGPVNEAHLMSNEDELAALYGKPTANNYETFFTAANFLAYGNQLYVSRALAGSNSHNAWAGSLANTQVYKTVKNRSDFEFQYLNDEDQDADFIAKYPGDLGNSLKISICASAGQYESSVLITQQVSNSVNQGIFANVQAHYSLTIGSNTMLVSVKANGDVPANPFYGFAVDSAQDIIDQLTIGDYIKVGDTVTGIQKMKVTGISTITDNSTGSYSQGDFTISFADKFKQKSSNTVYTANGSAATAFTRYWEYHDSVDRAPGVSNYVAARNANTAVNDELHIVVEDTLGKITGVPGQTLEVWEGLSRAKEARGEQGGSLYYRDVLNKSSQYIWSTTDAFTSGSAIDTAFPAIVATSPTTYSFINGVNGNDENEISVGNLTDAYDKFKSSEDIDVSLILGGKARGGNQGEQLGNYLIDNIAEFRKDCVVFISPNYDSVVVNPNQELNDLIAFRNELRSTSYAVIDSGYKYQYDKYSDVYRWVPLNGDIAGLCARTDQIRDPWFSPAGFNRGNIKNVVKLAYNPDKADRDQLYKSGINPVVNFPGQGVILYGDKTLLAKPSAFDRINVRRLFIVLEKAIATAAKFALFELNDDFTRASFRNLVEPYLRDIQGRRGIYDFRVVCDSTNNTPEVIDRNEFRGDIYIKPARSINFIQLNFVAVRTGVEFEEIVGKF